MVSEIDRQRRFDIYSSAAGGRLEAAWIGPGPKVAPTLVFLHEGLGCVALWRDFPGRLAEMTGCGGLVFSRLGYGRSDPCPLPKPVDFMHHEGLAVLPEVIRQTGIRDHFLVGHSDGGSIALIGAGSNCSSGLLGVVTLAAHVYCEAITRRSIREARRRYLNGDLKSRLSVYHGANTDCAFWGWNDVWLHPDFKKWTIENVLPSIRVPVLAIQGEADPYGSRDQIDRLATAAGGPVAINMVPACGHAPHIEKTDKMLAVIAAFIADR